MTPSALNRTDSNSDHENKLEKAEHWIERYLLSTTLLAAIFTAFLVESSKLLDRDINTRYLLAILQQLQGVKVDVPPLPELKRADKALNIVWFCGLAFSIAAVGLCLAWSKVAIRGRRRLSLRSQDEESALKEQRFEKDFFQERVRNVEELVMGPLRWLIMLSILVFYIGIVLRFAGTDIHIIIYALAISFFVGIVVIYLYLKEDLLFHNLDREYIDIWLVPPPETLDAFPGLQQTRPRDTKLLDIYPHVLLASLPAHKGHKIKAKLNSKVKLSPPVLVCYTRSESGPGYLGAGLEDTRDLRECIRKTLELPLGTNPESLSSFHGGDAKADIKPVLPFCVSGNRALVTDDQFTEDCMYEAREIWVVNRSCDQIVDKISLVAAS